MTIALDAFNADAIASGNTSFTSTPSGTPDAVYISVIMLSTLTNLVTSITYGGDTPTQVTGSPFGVTVTNEDDVTFAGYLLNNPNSGAQTVAVNYSDTTSDRVVSVYTFTTVAGRDIELQSSESNSDFADALDIQPDGIILLGGNTCFVSEVFLSGRANVNGVAPTSPWVPRIEVAAVAGSQVLGSYSFPIVSSDVTTGLSHNVADMAVWFATAFKEVVGPGRIMSSLVNNGGLAGTGGMAGQGGGLAG